MEDKASLQAKARKPMTSVYNPTLPSVFGLTCLLFIGLVFFIRASTKDRTEVGVYHMQQDDVTVMTLLQEYFAKRGYRVRGINNEIGEITLAGTVQASIFLAIFLAGLAGVGFFCLALILTITFPQLGYIPYLLLFLSPGAAWFYWRGARRVETVTFRLLPADAPSKTNQTLPETRLTVAAHRDELAVLESQVPLKRVEAE